MKFILFFAGGTVRRSAHWALEPVPCLGQERMVRVQR